MEEAKKIKVLANDALVPVHEDMDDIIEYSPEPESSSSPLPENVDDDLNFINLVPEYRCLWDTSCPDYSDRVKVENSWKEIMEKMPGVTNPKKKWKNLRGSYARYKSVKIPSESAAVKRRPYKYADVMNFLDDVIRPNSTLSTHFDNTSSGIDVEKSETDPVRELTDALLKTTREKPN